MRCGYCPVWRLATGVERACSDLWLRDRALGTELNFSIVAVHGLASTPTTTWESRNKSKRGDITGEDMWAFNHNTSWQAHALSKSLHDCGDDLLNALRSVRQIVEVRRGSFGWSL